MPEPKGDKPLVFEGPIDSGSGATIRQLLRDVDDLRTELARRDEVIAAARELYVCEYYLCPKPPAYTGDGCLAELREALARLDAATPAESGPNASQPS